MCGHLVALCMPWLMVSLINRDGKGGRVSLINHNYDTCYQVAPVLVVDHLNMITRVLNMITTQYRCMYMIPVLTICP